MDEEHVKSIRHSLAHLLAQAVIEKYPGTKVASGPPTDTGFYYDFDMPEGTTLSQEDFPALEERMRELAAQHIDFVQADISPEEAREQFTDQPYRLEKIEEKAADGKQLSMYTSGDFTDLCSGPHVSNTKEIDPESFQLTNIAGAYWKGDENNAMLTRVYGLAFASKKDLDQYLEMQEEARKRDHRKLGKELDLFSFSPLVGSGLPLWSPKGTVLRTELQNRLTDISKKYDMQPVTIPHLAKRALYETSGHADKFSDELLQVQSQYEELVMKPVNCPHHTQIYASQPRSYRDLPLRYMESTMQYRDEKPGEIGGLTRVRAITVDDGHIFCTPDQVKEEARRIARIIEEFYTSLGLFGNHWVSLSVRDPQTPNAYVGDVADWEKAESMLEELSNDMELNATRVEGEAAIYGPKLDYMFKDSLGREWQLATIQIDFAIPKRFSLEYTADDGSKKTPVIIHRAILGSYERFLAILIEHFAGAFPTWLSPVQVKVLPVSEGQKEYAQEITQQLRNSDIRAELDESNETLGKKVRNAQIEKVPYWIVVGDKEKEGGVAVLEGRNGEKEDPMDIEHIANFLKEQVSSRR